MEFLFPRSFMMKSPSLWLWSFCLFALATFLGGCSQDDNRPNIILLTLDTTRSDHLGCYGHPGGASPFLDALAQTGVVFEQARSQVPITMPSHTSIMTGTYPSVHGVHQHTDIFNNSNLPTLAEILSDQGYQTAAFIGAKVLDSRFGLDRGFDAYFDDINAGSAGGVQNNGRKADSRRAAKVIADAQRWFEKRPPGPTFSWLHFFDPHLVYDAPEPFAGRFPQSPYLAEISYMDAQIGAFLEWLDSRGELENTIVVAMADHGESLGEHGIHGHTEYVYQEVLRIPLIISWPGRVPAGKRVPELVRSIDLLPTLLEYLELPKPDHLQGENLQSLLLEESSEPRISYFESRYLENLFGWAPLEGVEYRSNKLIRSPDSELYDLVADPAEMHNVFLESQALSHRLLLLLDDVLQQTTHALDPAGTTVDEVTRDALTSLGYANAQPRALDSQAAGENPADHKEAVQLYQKIMAGPRASSTLEDLEIMNQLAQLETQQPGLQMLHGQYLAHFQKIPQALAAFERAARLIPHLAKPRLQQYTLAMQSGLTQEAASYLQKAVAADSLDALAHFEMAEHQARQGSFQQAGKHYKKSLELDPGSVRAMGHYAALLVYQGQDEAALPWLEKSFSLNPKDETDAAFRHYLLGRILYSKSGKREKSVEHLQQSLQLNPEIKGPNGLLALHFDQTGEKNLAIQHARNSLRLNPQGEHAIQMKTLSN